MNGSDLGSLSVQKQMSLHFFVKFNYINNFEFPKIFKIELNILMKNNRKKETLGTFFFFLKTFKQKPFFKLLKKKTLKSKYYIKDFKMFVTKQNFNFYFVFFLNSLSFLKKDFKILKFPKKNVKKGISSFYLKNVPYNSFNNIKNTFLNIKTKISTNISEINILETFYNSKLIPLNMI
jgi:hypothetical protein